MTIQESILAKIKAQKSSTQFSEEDRSSFRQWIWENVSIEEGFQVLKMGLGQTVNAMKQGAKGLKITTPEAIAKTPFIKKIRPGIFAPEQGNVASIVKKFNPGAYARA